MKKTIALFVSAVILLALAACGQTTASSSSIQSNANSSIQPSSVLPVSSQTTSQDVRDDDLLLEKIIRSYQNQLPTAPDFLTEKQQHQYRAAFVIAVETNGLGTGFGSTPESDMLTEPGGATYHSCNGAIRTWAELETAVSLVFTEDCFSQMNASDTSYPSFIEKEGQLYHSDAARGADITYTGQPDDFQLVSRQDDAIQFDIVGHYQDDDGPAIHRHPVKMVNTPAGWRFAQFELPF